MTGDEPAAAADVPTQSDRPTQSGPTTQSARQRRFEARRQLLLQIAVRVAEAEGWEAVTTRRLAEEIDYTQPVVYQHFRTRDELVDTIVREGFVELTNVIGEAAEARDSLDGVCRGYLEFSQRRPRVYEAMFTRPTALRFAHQNTPPELRASFDALAAVIARHLPDGADSAEVAASAELFWACCHGLATLLASSRIPPDRVDAHVVRICGLVRS